MDETEVSDRRLFRQSVVPVHVSACPSPLFREPMAFERGGRVVSEECSEDVKE